MRWSKGEDMSILIKLGSLLLFPMLNYIVKFQISSFFTA